MDVKYILKEAKYYKKITGLSRAVKKFLFTQTFFSNFVNGRIYQKFYQNAINKKSKLIKPRILQIENTNLCNAKCVMCPHVVMKREKKLMSFEDFKKIVDNVLNSYDIKRITMNGFGEPFVDKGVIDKIKYVNERYPDVKIDIYTNASILTPELSDKLLKTKVDRITFSINGTKKNYKKIMGLEYDKTKKNVLYFHKRRREMNHHVLTNLSVMILDENKDDVQEFVKFWEPIADSVRAYVPSDWAGGVKNIIQIPPFKHNKRWPCFVLWSNITVDVNGDMIMCCRDYESRVSFGNLLKQDIKEIRSSKDFKELLRKQLNFDFKTRVCDSCDNVLESSLDWVC